MRGSDYNDLNGEFLDFRKTGCLVDVVAHGSSIVLLYSSSSSSSCYLFIYLFFFFGGGGGWESNGKSFITSTNLK